MRTMKILGFLFLVAVFSLCALPAAAAPVVYSFQGVGSGTVGGESFSNAEYTISLNGDTSNVVLGGGIDSVLYSYEGEGMTISIAGIDAATISGDVYIRCGWVIPGPAHCDLYSGSQSVAFLNMKFDSGAPRLNETEALASATVDLGNFTAVPTTLGPLTMTASTDPLFVVDINSGILVSAPILGRLGMFALISILILITSISFKNYSARYSKQQ